MKNKNIVIAGASGDLGRRITALLLKEIPAENLTLVTRSPDNLAEMASSGVKVCKGDYDNPDELVDAFTGGDCLFLVSGLAINERIQQHRNAITAAKKAGISHIVYTSTLGVQPSNPTLSAKEHIVTEDDLRHCGLSYTILRNVFYAEVIATLIVAPALETGKWIMAAGEGSLAPVSKHNIAECVVACLLDPEKHHNAIYEITGPEMFTFREIAAMASDVYGIPIEYVPITPEERYAIFDEMGIPRNYEPGMFNPAMHAWPSDEMVSADIGIAQNYLAIQSRHVEMITGKPAISLREIFEKYKGKTYYDNV